jgi:hypothetical protein
MRGGGIKPVKTWDGLHERDYSLCMQPLVSAPRIHCPMDQTCFWQLCSVLVVVSQFTSRKGERVSALQDSWADIRLVHEVSLSVTRWLPSVLRPTISCCFVRFPPCLSLQLPGRQCRWLAEHEPCRVFHAHWAR